MRDLIEAAHSYKSVEKYTSKKKIMEYIVQNIDQYASNPRRSKSRDSIFQKVKYFSESLFCGSGIYLGNYLVTTYFFIKIVYLVNSIVQFFIMNEFLGKQFHELGIDILRYLTNTYNIETSAESVYFPKVVMCDFRIREFGHPNFSHRYTIQCVLPINLYNQQIFTFLWFWFLILFCANFWAMCQWVNRMLPKNRRRYINRRLNMLKYFKELNESTSIIVKKPGLFINRRKSISFEAKKQKRNFIEEYLKFDGVFILRMISMLTSEIVGTELLHELWTKRAVYTNEKEEERNRSISSAYHYNHHHHHNHNNQDHSPSPPNQHNSQRKRESDAYNQQHHHHHHHHLDVPNQMDQHSESSDNEYKNSDLNVPNNGFGNISPGNTENSSPAATPPMNSPRINNLKSMRGGKVIRGRISSLRAFSETARRDSRIITSDILTLINKQQLPQINASMDQPDVPGSDQQSESKMGDQSIQSGEPNKNMANLPVGDSISEHHRPSITSQTRLDPRDSFASLEGPPQAQPIYKRTKIARLKQQFSTDIHSSLRLKTKRFFSSQIQKETAGMVVSSSGHAGLNKMDHPGSLSSIVKKSSTGSLHSDRGHPIPSTAASSASRPPKKVAFASNTKEEENYYDETYNRNKPPGGASSSQTSSTGVSSNATSNILSEFDDVFSDLKLDMITNN